MGPIILVVEDNDSVRQAIADLLTLEDYTVYTATDGRDAFDLLQDTNRPKWTPDLIVCDILMPHMNGYDFFTAIRNEPTLRYVPIIFLTARGESRDIRFGLQLGVDDYLVKPFAADDLLIAIQSKLRKRQDLPTHSEGDSESDS